MLKEVIGGARLVSLRTFNLTCLCLQRSGLLALYRGARELGFSLWRLSYREDFTAQSGPQLSRGTVRISLFAHWCPYSNLILNFSPTREIPSGDERGSEGHGGLC